MSLLVFLVVTLAIWLPRINVPYLNDDTLAVVGTSISLLGDGQDPALLADMGDRFNIVLDKFRVIWADSGYRFAPYRPLSDLLSLKLIFWPYAPGIPTLFHGMVLGATAALLYLLVVELTGKKLVALASSLLYAFSVPSLVGTWLVVHSQPFTNLFIMLGLLGYIRYVKYHQKKWLVALWVSAIFAPFFRELAFILPATVLVLMVLERKWDKPLLISMPLLLAHASFPSFMPNLLHGAIVIQSQFRGGFSRLVPLEMDAGLIANVIARYKTVSYPMPYQLALFVPPLVTLLAMGGVTWFIFDKSKRISKLWLLAAVVLAAGAISGLLIIGGWSYTFKVGYRYLLPLAFFFLVPLASFRFGKLFPAWLFVAGIPFLILYNNQDLHIWPASVPWIVMIMLWVDSFTGKLRGWVSAAQTRHILARSVYFVTIFILVIGFVDQIVNIASVRTVWREIGAKTMQIGERLREAPKGSMVVANLYHTVDVEYFAHSQVKHYLSIDWKDYIPGRVLSERADLEKAISEIFPEKDVYLLVETGNHRSDQYLDNPPGTLVLVDNFTVHSRYYFLDPLHNLAPQALWKKTAPPDLLYSFIRSGGLFYREYNQTYSLYKLTSFSPRTAGGK